MSPGAPTDARWFRQVLGQYPTGVCVVTATPPDGRHAGFVVGSFTSVSLDPPLVAFFPDKGSTSWPRIQSARSFCVNVLSASQEDVCRRFASRVADKFDGLSFRRSPSGSPIVDGVVAWIDCDLESVQDAGDHYIVLGRVRELDVDSPSLPLLFFQGGYGRFAPLSLAAANSHGMLTQELRAVDLLRPEMERTAASLSARCLATAPVGEELVVIASAGSPSTASRATLVGQRLPLSPPTGSALVAWSDATAIESYLARLPSDDARTDHRERLAAVRRRGYSVGLLNEAQRRFAATLDRLAEDPAAVAHDDLRGLVRDLDYDPVELPAARKRQIRTITVPVFGPDGKVALALALYGFAKPRAEAGIDAYIRRAREAAEWATERLGGRTPAAGQ
jgi:flavin reductase (DIM6/NTAB) family NADH-FMN oxidoreductase RutF/DNA-binding IclR family transcriptional regulator